MTDTSSAAQGIRVPTQTIAQANKQKLENLLENDDVLAQFDYAGKDAKNFWQEMCHCVQAKSDGPPQDILDKQIAKQNAVPVHSVFRANDKIVAIVTENGSVTSTDGLGPVSTAGSPDEIAQRVKERLVQMYGHVQMVSYPSGSGINVGMAEGEMFGRGPRIPSPDDGFASGKNPRLRISGESLALFQEAQKS